MGGIAASIVSGSGTPPKDIEAGSYLLLQSVVAPADLYTWEVMSSPENSGAYIDNPIGSFTRFGPLSESGVYLVYLYTNIGMYNQKIYTIALNVPGTVSPSPLPDPPFFDTGGRVRNFSFELPGIVLGTADKWDTVADAGVLDTDAGVSRGRIVPVNFTVTSGLYVMCVGDDLGGTSPLLVGDEFAVSQEADFTNVNTLSIQIKYRK